MLVQLSSDDYGAVAHASRYAATQCHPRLAYFLLYSFHRCPLYPSASFYPIMLPFSRCSPNELAVSFRNALKEVAVSLTSTSQKENITLAQVLMENFHQLIAELPRYIKGTYACSYKS